MNIEQVKEALARIGNGDKSHKIQDTLIAVDAARRFVDGWETCPTCNGKGAISEQAKGSLGGYRGRPCPDCVNGMIPGPQLVERLLPVLEIHLPEEVKPYASRMVEDLLVASRRENDAS